MSNSNKHSPLVCQHQAEFDQIINMIQESRDRAIQTVNVAMVDLYWEIGQYISDHISTANWGDGVITELAEYISKNHPFLKGFSRSNLFKMKLFYETYLHDEKVSPLVRQLPWTHNQIIFTQCKTPSERKFYLSMTLQEKWSKRELQRQINTSLFERTQLSSSQFVSPAVRQIHPDAPQLIQDRYILDFLGLPERYPGSDLRQALVKNLKQLLLELGREFCFIGENYRLQVGAKDFYLDLLFFHRTLRCLIAFELKVEEFQPAHMGQLSFYLEALDRDVKHPEENPSVGVLLCKSRDKDVVEYSLSRTLSPTLVGEYQTHLPDKQLLEKQLGLLNQPNHTSDE